GDPASLFFANLALGRQALLFGAPDALLLSLFGGAACLFFATARLFGCPLLLILLRLDAVFLKVHQLLEVEQNRGLIAVFHGGSVHRRSPWLSKTRVRHDVPARLS